MEDKLDVCFAGGCPYYGHCSNMMEGLIEEDKIDCVFYWLVSNDIEVRDSEGNKLDLETLWSKAHRTL